MRLGDLVLDPNTGVHVTRDSSARIFRYTDGPDVEARLLRIVESASDITSSSRELEAAITDWSSRYHLDSRRANVLRALDHLSSTARVLELGAGCGALTRYLGERFAKVDAVEGSLPLCLDCEEAVSRPRQCGSLRYFIQ